MLEFLLGMRALELILLCLVLLTGCQLILNVSLLKQVQGVGWRVGRLLDREIRCERCGRPNRLVHAYLSCSCADPEVKARIGYCVGVSYCPDCTEDLRLPDGTLPAGFDTGSTRAQVHNLKDEESAS